jgi:cysteine desulfurase/selenocysteine lyase
MSNVLGVAQDVAQIVKAARQKNPKVITVVDAAQFVVHDKIDVRAWDCDFVCWSGHKIGADTGVGVLYIKNPDDFQPVKFGGGMVNKILDNKVIWNMPPDVFEAGTLPLTQIAGLAQAIDDLGHNRPNMDLIKYAYDELSKISNIKILSQRDACILTFVVEGMHALDFGALMGARDVCLRVGNMCASWIFRAMGLDGAIRMSVGAYNILDDIKYFVKCVKEIVK